MKRLFILSLVLGVGLGVFVGVALMRILDGASATAAGGEQAGRGAAVCASQSGDVNADGKVDLSDGIYIINYVFRGGPQPACQAPLKGGSLPATGQTKCYARDTESPCESAAACPGQDGSYAKGCPSEGRFVDNGDGTVTDTCTGLLWQKNTSDVNGDGQTPDDQSDALSWCDALAYCENLSFAGHDDWRLPNLRELQSIVDYGNSNPAIDSVFGVLSSYYWASTTYVVNPDVAWRVRFDIGFVDGNNKASFHYVRAVRTAP